MLKGLWGYNFWEYLNSSVSETSFRTSINILQQCMYESKAIRKISVGYIIELRNHHRIKKQKLFGNTGFHFTFQFLVARFPNFCNINIISLSDSSFMLPNLNIQTDNTANLWQLINPVNIRYYEFAIVLTLFFNLLMMFCINKFTLVCPPTITPNLFSYHRMYLQSNISQKEKFRFHLLYPQPVHLKLALPGNEILEKTGTGGFLCCIYIFGLAGKYSWTLESKLKAQFNTILIIVRIATLGGNKINFVLCPNGICNNLNHFETLYL